MNVTRPRVLAVVVFAISCLLIVFAANCSVEQQTADDSSHKQVEEISAKQTKEKQDGQQNEEEPFVANEFCAACHYNFIEDELALEHKLAGIGCERCHGESERHRSDEDNTTPPEIMYPRERINPTCMMCHPRQEITHVRYHDPLLAGAETIFDEKSAGKKMCCTDCHAKDHLIKVRAVRWNKQTGEIL